MTSLMQDIVVAGTDFRYKMEQKHNAEIDAMTAQQFVVEVTKQVTRDHFAGFRLDLVALDHDETWSEVGVLTNCFEGRYATFRKVVNVSDFMLLVHSTLASTFPDFEVSMNVKHCGFQSEYTFRLENKPI